MECIICGTSLDRESVKVCVDNATVTVANQYYGENRHSVSTALGRRLRKGLCWVCGNIKSHIEMETKDLAKYMASGLD